MIDLGNIELKQIQLTLVH